MTEDVKKPPRLPRLLRAWAAALLALTIGALGSSGCSEECSGENCACQSDSTCSAKLRCLQQECRSSCEGDSDCHGGQVCRGWQFEAGDEGNYCVEIPGVSPSGGSAAGDSQGRFTPCESNAECDSAHGFDCVAGECSYACESHADCVAVGHCETQLVEGERKRYCVKDETPPEPGKLYTACPKGDECSEATLCVGAGPGDTDAYCSVDCSGDADCAAGYQCGRITRPPCEDACDERGEPLDPRCVPLDQIGEGLPFQCTDEGVTRSVCRAREFCASCQTDADCLAVPNQVCAKDESGDKICTRLCDTGTRSCPWGNAARCAVFDDDLGVPTCSHRSGACSGQGKTCEPCRDDSDCPGGACAVSSFTGEHWCVDFRVSCSCARKDAADSCTNGGCPDTPGGLTVMCVDDDSDRIPDGYCYAANSTSATDLGASPQTGCWDPQ